jgi:hypothetical protein
MSHLDDQQMFIKATKRVLKDVRPYQSLDMFTDDQAAEIWCMVTREEIERLRAAYEAYIGERIPVKRAWKR